jgi:hypothetical protein
MGTLEGSQNIVAGAVCPVYWRSEGLVRNRTVVPKRSGLALKSKFFLPSAEKLGSPHGMRKVEAKWGSGVDISAGALLAVHWRAGVKGGSQHHVQLSSDDLRNIPHAMCQSRAIISPRFCV